MIQFSFRELGNFRILSPNGQIIRGSDTQIEFLKGWFEAENPKWKTNFSFAMRLEGQKGEWVISRNKTSPYKFYQYWLNSSADFLKIGSRHPISIVKNKIIDIFSKIGFDIS